MGVNYDRLNHLEQEAASVLKRDPTELSTAELQAWGVQSPMDLIANKANYLAFAEKETEALAKKMVEQPEFRSEITQRYLALAKETDIHMDEIAQGGVDQDAAFRKIIKERSAAIRISIRISAQNT